MAPTAKKAKDRRGDDPGLWRRMTAAQRALPEALIIGAQRAGTTSCFRYLAQHPQLVRPIRKEVHFFDSDADFERGESWYRAFFPKRAELARLEAEDGKRRVVIEATPAYMYREHAIPRMARLLPGAKLIATLRNPIERALSNWKLVGEHGRQYGTFEEEVEHELALEAGQPGPVGDQRPRGLLARGRYAEQIERIWEHYPKEQLYVADSAGLFRDPTEYSRPIFEFLDLEPIEIDAGKKHNLSKDRQPVSPELRARMQAYFGPWNARLFELLGVDYGWNG